MQCCLLGARVGLGQECLTSVPGMLGPSPLRSGLLEVSGWLRGALSVSKGFIVQDFSRTIFVGASADFLVKVSRAAVIVANTWCD